GNLECFWAEMFRSSCSTRWFLAQSSGRALVHSLLLRHRGRHSQSASCTAPFGQSNMRKQREQRISVNGSEYLMLELSRFTKWRVGVGFAYRGGFKASLRLLCLLLF